MHLVDHARAHIETTYDRPLHERALRALLAFVLTRPGVFRLALRAAPLGKRVAKLLPASLRPLMTLAPDHVPPPSDVDRPQVFPAVSPRRMRVALLNGCAQTVLDTRINEATLRFLTRHGVEVVVAEGAGCCGALPHHLGKVDASHALARANIEAWTREIEAGGLDHVVINTSGCGVSVKDYGYMFRDSALAEKAARISAIACDVTEIVEKLAWKAGAATPLKVAYHAACSLQHGQKITRQPVEALTRAGFEVFAVPEGHICCGSAGTYNLLQAELADQLRARKVAHIESVAPDVIAAGNLGCIKQIGAGTAIPIVHTIELLDWATGGPPPRGLRT